MDAVTELGTRDRGSALRDRLEPRIARDLPVDVDVGHRHPAALEWARRQARPQHDAVRQRIARRNANRERVTVENWFGERAAAHERRRHGAGPEVPRDLEEFATRETGERAIVERHRRRL